ncbi:MAG: class I SAM-dependent methyltransferase [Solirubrobacteraceae bacterium]
MAGMACPACDAGGLEEAFAYRAQPDGETVFDLGEQTYRRRYLRCPRCGHYLSDHELDLAALYEGEYMDATYAGDRLRSTYERIMALPPERSDNAARVHRICSRLRPGSVLDVGSGLGVFPARMKEAGWRATALDPDARAIAHARDHIGVDAVQADFMAPGELSRYDLVTLNKVLEHVEDPVAMLRRAHAALAEGGTVYIELPDGECAAADGAGREEFFIEHLHVFSMASMCLLAARAGFVVRAAERLREPSDKYTLYAFLEAA